MKKSSVFAFFTVLVSAPTALAQSATITWNKTYQTIDGFGASDHAAGQVANSEDTLFFSTLGYSMLRTGTPEDGSCTSVSSACADNGDSVTDMLACAAHGCRVWATSWTPPAIYKTNNNIACGAGSGNGSLSTSSYAAFATYLSNYIASLQKYHNIKLYAISPQNEPDICVSYDSSVMSGSQFDTFIKNNLGPTLAANGQSSTLIVMPEPAGYYDYTNYAGPCMSDAACASFVGVTALHGYDNSFSINNPYNKPFWETEVSAGPGYGPSASGCSNGQWCPGIADAMMWAKIIDYNIVTAGESAWLYWWLVNANGGDNEGLVDNGQVSLRAYVLGNYAKFVRPGWVRIDATHAPQSGVTISAYKDPGASGQFAIVATNQNSSSVSQAFSMSGFTAKSVTPWTTSATLKLAQQSAVSVSSSGFTYTLPGSSVTTFAGSLNGSTPPPPPPPTSSFFINAGATTSYIASNGQVWSADADYSGGTANAVTQAITKTKDATLYQTERYGPFTYTFNVQPGSYTVTLKFAELYETGPNLRQFNVTLDGQQVLTNFDIFAASGGEFTAVDRTFQVKASSSITIQFVPITGKNNPEVTAISVQPVGGTAGSGGAGGAAPGGGTGGSGVAGSASGGTAGTDAGVGMTTTTGSSGCSCSVTGANSTSKPALGLFLFAAGWIEVRRRRHRRISEES